MLPFHTNVNKPNKTIYINPDFKGRLPAQQTPASFQPVIPKNAHINPLFLEVQKCRNTIHMNPAFLQKFQDYQQQQIVIENDISERDPSFMNYQANKNLESNTLLKKSVSAESRKIICKSKNRLIREPLSKSDEQSLRTTNASFPLQPLLVLNKRKLIRKVSAVPVIEKNTYTDFKSRVTKYKLDNRMARKKSLLPPTPRIKRTSYVCRYALKRTFSNETLKTSGKKILSTNKNKKLEVLNINGLLYKSTKNSLKLKDITAVRISKSSKPNVSGGKLSSNTNQGLILFVRGHKYVMDANKFKLTRVTNCDYNASNHVTRNNSIKAPNCQRIDIGGYTYVSVNSAKNVLIRTTNHWSRAYVHNAKQRSLQMLTKRLVKTNIPCPIFQRIGKCAAFERGKCSKVHNKLQVAICSKFLRGECLSSNCLLSHNISLSKMPVCKFFLQGVCVRNDCPYLHKKLSNSTELCTDFLRGFCHMADKCNKRHEFVCPEIERNNKCSTKNCIYCNAKRRKELQIGIKMENIKNNNKNATTSTMSAVNIPTEVTENQCCKRYFVESCDKTINNSNEFNGQFATEDTTNDMNVTGSSNENVRNSPKTRPKLGTLPAYIPL